MKSLSVCILLGLVAQAIACANIAVYNLCTSTGNNQLNACGATDYGCKCAAQKVILGCYDDCPDDETIQSQRPVQAAQVQIYCGQAGMDTSLPSGTAAPMSTTFVPFASSASPLQTASVHQQSASMSGSASASQSSSSTSAGASLSALSVLSFALMLFALL
ncbi:hypothetical protein BZG36_00204 [Bifiguratus adelaidae]|uniref:Extracellular membrane protein CFEM domain-containing protein n=1 Tax=Bifiguratus adelaidae TaxID=1938954 RepID=A0A261Y9A3_9FUNG|nr:hypothetical protein BZG36_00204 [Bifiguratus adelaidae]